MSPTNIDGYIVLGKVCSDEYHTQTIEDSEYLCSSGAVGENQA